MIDEYLGWGYREITLTPSKITINKARASNSNKIWTTFASFKISFDA